MGGNEAFMQVEVGSIIEGKVTGITKFGAFVDLGEGKTGMVHISEVAATYVKEIRDFIQEGQTVKVKVLTVSDDGKISLSIKKAAAPVPRAPRPQVVSPGRPGEFEWRPQRNNAVNFEDMMSHFKQTSDEKMSDLKRSLDNKHGGFTKKTNRQQP